MKLSLEDRIQLAVKLGKFLGQENDFLEALIKRTHFNNQWLTPENYSRSIQAIKDHFLDENLLRSWLNKYAVSAQTDPRKIGLVLAGNIPLVGFHDILTTFMAGHYALIKPSSRDAFVLPYLLQEVVKMNPDAAPYFQLVDQLKSIDGVIATGSNNSARYFETYFGKYPNIIRKNRNAVAVLTGKETKEDLEALSKDIFTYFGLGCRNVSKLYVPDNFDFIPLLETTHEHRELVLHSKYKNNFDYNFALFTLNSKKFLSNGCLMLTEEESLQSRISVLHFEYYKDAESLQQKLASKVEEIQLVVGAQHYWDGPSASFGQAQQPELDDYADGIDTMNFLLGL